MVGEWVEERPDASVRLSCRWAEGGNFLLREVTVKREGKPVMSISQRIGWDPLARQVRSWEFDSAGGFGEGRWSRDGDRWTIKHTGVQAEGTASSATNIMTKERPDVVRWVSTDRVVGDETLPDTEADVLVRVPPPPQIEAEGSGDPRPVPRHHEEPAMNRKMQVAALGAAVMVTLWAGMTFARGFGGGGFRGGGGGVPRRRRRRIRGRLRRRRRRLRRGRWIRGRIRRRRGGYGGGGFGGAAGQFRGGGGYGGMPHM